MSDKGYRAQPPLAPEAAVSEPKGSLGVGAVIVGVLAVAATAVAITFMVTNLGMVTGEKAPNDEGAAPPAQEVQFGDVGADTAPVRVLAMPGHCEEHLAIAAHLRQVAEANPDALQVRFRGIGDAEASAEGMGCAGYALWVDGVEPEGSTANGYRVLGTQMPGMDYNLETIDQAVTEALASKGFEIATPPVGDLGGPLPGSEAIGNENAPVQVLAVPGDCEGHLKTVALLRDMAEERPEDLRVVVRSIGAQEALAEGLSCAGYMLKIRDLKPTAAMTPGGYEILGMKSPGLGWTPESVTTAINDALDQVAPRAESEDPSPEEDVPPPLAAPV